MAKLNINGKLVDIDVDGATPLLWVLREQLGLTGTKYSCGIGLCGACTVHINGKAVRSCVVPVSSLNNAPASVGGTGRSAVRLLSAGHDHDRGGAAQGQS